MKRRAVVRAHDVVAVVCPCGVSCSAATGLRDTRIRAVGIAQVCVIRTVSRARLIARHVSPRPPRPPTSSSYVCFIFGCKRGVSLVAADRRTRPFYYFIFLLYIYIYFFLKIINDFVHVCISIVTRRMICICYN